MVAGKKEGLTPLKFNLGYEGSLDSLVECIKENLKSLRDEKIRFWKEFFKKYKEDKEAYDLEFRTKQTQRKKDLDSASKIDIKDYIKRFSKK